MNKRYDSVYLSPHLDDAILSCGGQIFLQTQAGRRVLVVTVMAGDPPERGLSDFAAALHERWKLDKDVVACRRQEDRIAARAVGAEVQHWTVPDCIYRTDRQTGAALYDSNEALFGAVHESEDALIRELSARMATLAAHHRLVVPLGVGNHVDHQITRRAAEKARSSGFVYYEEYPYVLIPGAVQQLIGEAGSTWWASTTVLTEIAIRKRLEATAAYESQISTFFPDFAALEKSVRSYCEDVGGERLWRHG